MKKTIAIIIGAILILTLCIGSFAGDAENRVYAQAVTVEAGEDVSIPILIENNGGFMGLSVTATYDASVFTAVSAQRGKMLNGLFNDSIGVSAAGTFTVVYSGAGNCTQDGTLFTVTLHTAGEAASGEYTIRLSYSQADTFNESWKDVVLQCEPITVQIRGTEPVTEPVTEPETEPQTEPETEPETEPAIEPEPKPIEKTLSQRMLDWLNGLPAVFKYMLWIFVRPLAALISLFE